MNKLSRREKLVLYGLVKYPHFTDKEIAHQVNMKVSTFSSIKQRLKKAGYFKKIRIPMLQRLGAELFCVTYTHFNQAVQLEARIQKTANTIEVFEEIFYSVGDTFRGFSISVARNYSDVTHIEDKRIEIFGQLGLLEVEYPTMVLFPFETSHIDRFLDYAPLLKRNFQIDDKDLASWKMEDVNGSQIDDIDTFTKDAFNNNSSYELSKTEMLIFCALVENPDLSDKSLGELLPLSRHTISNTRRKLETQGILRTLCIPSLKLLNFDVLSIYHMTYNPGNVPEPDQVTDRIMDDSTIFLCSRRFESFMISAYPDYETAKDESARMIQYLKSNDLMADKMMIEEFSVKNMITIKDIKFGPIARKIVGES